MKSVKRDAKRLELTFYDKLVLESDDKMSYERMKFLALERMRLLRKIENRIFDTSAIDNLNQDLLTHFCLRLVASQAQWSLSWLVTMETRLFRHRVYQMNEDEFNHFYQQRFLTKINRTEENNGDDKRLKMNDHDSLITPDCYYDPDITNRPTEYSRIHFTKCSDMLGKRLYPLEKGFFHSRPETRKSFVVSEFKNFIETQMDNLFRQNSGDERLLRLHNDIFMSYGNPETAKGDKMSITNLKTEDMPLCMKLLFSRLNKEGHLKYNDRNQLALFLKDLNVSFDEALNYMRSKLPRMKEKELSYNVRHNYGLEGKRANYGCFSCQKIISLSSDMSATGCPFVKNRAYAQQFINIEDGADAYRSCKTHLISQVSEENLRPEDLAIRTPADFYKAIRKLKKDSEKPE